MNGTAPLSHGSPHLHGVRCDCEAGVTISNYKHWLPAFLVKMSKYFELAKKKGTWRWSTCQCRRCPPRCWWGSQRLFNLQWIWCVQFYFYITPRFGRWVWVGARPTTSSTNGIPRKVGIEGAAFLTGRTSPVRVRLLSKPMMGIDGFVGQL